MIPVLAALLLLPTALSYTSCTSAGGEDQAAVEAETPKAELFTVSDRQLEHLKILPAARMNWDQEVHTTGTVDWNADQTTQVITQVSGPVSRILVGTGDRVRAGQPLLYVSSPEIAGALSDYRKAKNHLDLAGRVLKRDRDLLAHHAIAKKELDASQADYNDASTEVDNTLQALRILGVTKAELEKADRAGDPINPEIAVRAPISGRIVQKIVLPGQLIQAGSTLCFVISNVSKVWVQAHIFENDLPLVRVGERADISTPSYLGVFRGRISYIGAAVDVESRTIPVRIVTENGKGLLKKDQYVEAIIHGGVRKNVLAVPVSSVLNDEDNQPFVFQEVEPGRFARRPVTTGTLMGESVEILSGLQEGQKVVSQGSLFLQFANTFQR